MKYERGDQHVMMASGNIGKIKDIRKYARWITGLWGE